MARKKKAAVVDLLLDMALGIAEAALTDSNHAAGRLVAEVAGAVRQPKTRRITKSNDGPKPGEVQIAKDVFYTPAPRR